MSNQEKSKKQVEWYDSPDVITNFIIILIGLIVILSQSFAINNNLSVANILGGILNHNIVYLLVFAYFVALKTKVGKKYFDFLNVFLIILHSLTALTSMLTLFQSFGLASLLATAIDILVLIFLIHTFLRGTRVWKSMNLSKSPFNETSNTGYFNSILVLTLILLAVNLVFTTSLDGTLLTLMDMGYTVLFIRYIYLYGEFLNAKKISVNNQGNFNEIRDKVKTSVGELTDSVLEKASDIKEDISDKLEDVKLDEKIEKVKESVSDLADDVKDELIELKENVDKKIKEVTETKKNTRVEVPEKKKKSDKEKTNESKKGSK